MEKPRSTPPIMAAKSTRPTRPPPRKPAPMTLQEAVELYQLPDLALHELREPAMQERAFQACREFLRDLPKIKHQNRRHGSYGYKHMVESPAGRLDTIGYSSDDHIGAGVYVYEGTFVLAALSLGFTPEPRRAHCVTINVSETALRKRVHEIVDAGRRAMREGAQ